MSADIYEKQPTKWITWRGRHIPVDENGAIIKIKAKRGDYQDKKAEQQRDKANLDYANKNKKLIGKSDITESEKNNLYKSREKLMEATQKYEDRMRAKYEQEEDDKNFENAYHKAHREKTVEAHNEYKIRSDRYAKKYGEEERTTMFNKSQESRRKEIAGENLTKKLTPKERAREIDKANGKRDYNSMTRRELAEIIVDDQIRRGIVHKEHREMQINGRLKGVGAIRPNKKSELIKGAKAIEEYNKKGK